MPRVNRAIGLLRLTRPANIITAVSDILAGVAVAAFVSGEAGLLNWQGVALLIIATSGLYGGGVVLNDVFDAELDRVERPERAIPSGLITKQTAGWLGLALLVLGISAAAGVHASGWFSISASLAAAIAVCAVVYDKWLKHHNWLGPVNMGLCRGLNLLLGMSILPAAVSRYYYLAVVPVLYIAAITMISRGEVHGGKKNILYGAALLYLLVMLNIFIIGLLNHNAVYTAIFVALFAIMVFPPLFSAIRTPDGTLIGKAVKWGVIALIVMNAAWAAAFGMTGFALAILLLLPVSLFLAKLFAVT